MGTFVITSNLPRQSLHSGIEEKYTNLALADHLPPGMSVLGYADDVAVMATAHNASLVEDVLNLTLERVAGGSRTTGSD